MFVDEAFIDLMRRKMGPEKWTRLTSDTRQRLIHDEWEHGIKQRFDARPNKIWSFNLPWECLDPKERMALTSLPKLSFTAQEIEEVFCPVVDKINTLIHRQVRSVKEKTNAYPKVCFNFLLPMDIGIFDTSFLITLMQYVILVGGFGRCKYLFQKIKAQTDLLLNAGIEVLQARGAEP